MRHARSRLRSEILDDDFLDVAVTVVELAQSKQRVDPLFTCFADADQDARGERDALFASRGAGYLSGEPWCGPPGPHSRSDTDSSMSPWDTETVRKAVTSARARWPGLRCGSKPVCSCTTRAAWAR